MTIMKCIERVGKLIPHNMIYEFYSAPWRIINGTEELVVKWYQTQDGKIWVALDRTIFYDFFLKEKIFKTYLQETEKTLHLEYTERKIVQRSKKESLSLFQFMNELGGVKKMKILLPNYKSLIDNVFNILKETQSFEAVEIRLENKKLLRYFIMKFILGARTRKTRLQIKRFVIRCNEGKSRLNYKNRGWINGIKSNLQPYWSKLSNFAIDYCMPSMEKFLVGLQSFTDVVLHLDIHRFSYRKEKILQKMAGSRIRNFLKRNELPEDDFEEKFPLHEIVFPMKCDIAFSFLGKLIFNASNYVILNDSRTLENEDIEELNEFHQKHFELALIDQCENGITSFKGTVTNLYMHPTDVTRPDNISSTLTCFPRVRHLHIELGLYEGFEETFTCEMFENLESITIEMMSFDAMKFLPKINQFINSKTIKRLTPSESEDKLLEETAWNFGWKLLPPRRIVDTIHYIESLFKQSHE